MPIDVGNSSSYVRAGRIHIGNGGVWVDAKEIHVGSGGVWNKVHQTITFSSNTRDVNLFTLAGSPTRPINLVVKINSGVIIGSTSTASPAMTTGALPAGSRVYIINQGKILGKGGQGGPGGGGSGSNGLPGGNALNITCETYLDNTGGIIGGGGGGGAGGATWPGHNPDTGGGGGGAGDQGGAGGAGYVNGSPGSPGTDTAGGANGGGHCPATDGAFLGATAANSGSCDAQPGATGGSPGKAVNLNGNTLTYIASGTIYGAVS